EVTAMSRTDHPNLVSIIDSGVEACVPYLVMDYHSGKAADPTGLARRRRRRLAGAVTPRRQRA
ncbi:MAG: hypothetical protein ACXVDD_13195, partial [Polyangia bacterium]